MGFDRVFVLQQQVAVNKIRYRAPRTPPTEEGFVRFGLQNGIAEENARKCYRYYRARNWAFKGGYQIPKKLWLRVLTTFHR